MKKIVIVSILAIVFLFLMLGCKAKETGRSVAPAISETSENTLPPPTEYSSADEIKNDVLRFQEALASQDAKKCEVIIGSDLKKRCAEKFASK